MTTQPQAHVRVEWSYLGPNGNVGGKVNRLVWTRAEAVSAYRDVAAVLAAVGRELDVFKDMLPCLECDGRGTWREDDGTITACYCQEEGK